MTTNARVIIAALLIGLYGALALGSSLYYYFSWMQFYMEADIARGVSRMVVTGVVAYFLYRRNKYAYWVALVGSGALGILGLVLVVLLSISAGFDTDRLLVLIPALSFTGAFVLLVPGTVRRQFHKR